MGIAPSLYAKVSTAHFNVYYTVFGGTSFAAENAKSAAAAARVAAIVEEVYDAEVKLIDPLDRLDDSKEACNGGDAKYDIYYGPYGLGGIAAWTTSYALAPEQIGKKSECALRPSYMMLNSQSVEFFTAEQQPANSRPMVKSILAHEFLHALQFTHRPRGELQGPRVDRRGHRAVGDGPPRADDRARTARRVRHGARRRQRRLRLPQERNDARRVSLRGAPDVDREARPGHRPEAERLLRLPVLPVPGAHQGADTIKQIFDALAGGRNSVEAIAAAVDMKSVWPAFARTSGSAGKTRCSTTGPTKTSTVSAWRRSTPRCRPLQTIPQEMKDRQKTTPVDQKGQKSAKFELLDNALAFSGNYEIEPRSILYEHLKFSDPTVHAVVFYNPIADRPDNGPMKLEALKKIGGKWQAPEDWTNVAFQTHCLDNQDERLEELLLIVSNSEANRASETPFTIAQPVADEAGHLERRLLAVVRQRQRDHRDGVRLHDGGKHDRPVHPLPRPCRAIRTTRWSGSTCSSPT